MSLNTEREFTQHNDTTDLWNELDDLRNGWKQDLARLTQQRLDLEGRMEEIDRTRTLLEGMIAQINDMDDRPKPSEAIARDGLDVTKLDVQPTGPTHF